MLQIYESCNGFNVTLEKNDEQMNERTYAYKYNNIDYNVFSKKISMKIDVMITLRFII